MKQIKKLAQLAQSLEQQTAVCKQCGVCLSACPLYPRTRRERDVARGKIAILEGVMSEVIKNADSVRDRLDRCLLCGGCAGVCPNGVNTLEIFLKARVLLTGYLGLSPLKKAVFRQFLVKPKRFNSVTALAAKAQGLFIKKIDSDLGTGCARFTASPLLADRHVVPLAPIPFHCQYRHQKGEHPKADRETVLFYTGCLIDKVFPQVAHAAVRALMHHGFHIVIPENEGCCGIPALSAGDNVSFRQLLSHNLDLFKNLTFDRLVTACATCAFTIKKVWPMMVDPEDDDYPYIRQLSEKTIDATELIVSAMDSVPPRPNPDAIKVTYHDPCHLKKSLGVFEAPRRLIAANPDYQLVEMKNSDTCCGMGGGFGLTYNDLSQEIGQSKYVNIMESGCQVVATACPACMIQLSGLLSGHGEKKMRVCHPVELYLDREPSP